MSTTALGVPAPGQYPYRTGYTETKHVSEQLLLHAARNGLSVTNFRLGMVCGNSQTGYASDSDILALFFKACVDLGTIPNIEQITQFMPKRLVNVDSLTQAMVDFTPDEHSTSVVVADSDADVQWQLFYEGLHNLGYQIEQVPFKHWQQQVEERTKAEPDSHWHSVKLAVADRQAFYKDTADRAPDTTDSGHLDCGSGPDGQSTNRLLGFYQQTLF